MCAYIDKTSPLLSKRPWARGPSDTIYCGRIDVCSSDFHVQEFRRNSLPVSFATISARVCHFFHAPLRFSLQKLYILPSKFGHFLYTRRSLLNFNTMNSKREWSYANLFTSSYKLREFENDASLLKETDFLFIYFK